MTVVVSHLDNERQRRRDSFRLGYIPPAELVVDPSVEFHTDGRARSRSGHLRGHPHQAVEPQRRPQRHHPPGVGLLHRGRGLRLQLCRHDRDRRRRHPQPVLHVFRRPGRQRHQVDPRAPLDERRHPRRRLVHSGRSLGRSQPSNGHGHLRAGLCRWQALRLAVQLLPPARARRHGPRGLRPRRHRRLHRGVLYASRQAGRGRAACGRTSSTCGPAAPGSPS